MPCPRLSPFHITHPSKPWLHSARSLLTPCPTHALHCSPTYHILTKYILLHITRLPSRVLIQENILSTLQAQHSDQTGRLTINLLRKQMSPPRGWVKCTAAAVSSHCYSRLYKLTICWASPDICEVHKSIRILSSHSLWWWAVPVCIITEYIALHHPDMHLPSIMLYPNRCSDHVM